MKKLIIALLTVGFFFSCEEDKTTYDGDTFVAFTDVNSTVGVPETPGDYTFEIGISKVQSSDVTINLSYEEGTAVAGTNFNLPSSVTIPAGEMWAEVALEIMDDGVYGVSTDLSITLESAGNYQVGFADLGSYQKNITIIDCPTKFTYWLGTLDVEDVGYGSTAGTGTITDDADCDILVVDNNLVGYSGAETTIYEIAFTSLSDEGEDGYVEVNTFVGEVASGDTTYNGYYTGYGTYDTATGTIEIDYEFAAYSGGSYVGAFWEGTTIITVAE